MPPCAVPFYLSRLKKPGAILAPMAGYSDAPMRQLSSEHGALWTVSEMISARGLVLGGESEHLNIGRPYPGESNRVVQLFGADPEILTSAVQKVEQWFNPAAIDLNMGCPVPKVRGKGGACLLQTPEVAYNLISAMHKATKLEISAKIRLGWDQDHSVEIAQGLADAGATIISVHGRTSVQRYTGEADWEAIARVAQSVPIPVIGSGDIQSVEQANARAKLGVAAVMIGRGAVGNPWIFRHLASHTNQHNQSNQIDNIAERLQTALRHAELQDAFYTVPHKHKPGEFKRASMRPLRKVLPKYLHILPELTTYLKQIETLEDVQMLLRPLLKKYQSQKKS